MVIPVLVAGLLVLVGTGVVLFDARRRNLPTETRRRWVWFVLGVGTVGLALPLLFEDVLIAADGLLHERPGGDVELGLLAVLESLGLIAVVAVGGPVVIYAIASRVGPLAADEG